MAVPGLCLPAHLLIVTLNLLLLQAPPTAMAMGTMYKPRHSFSRRLPKRLCPMLPPTLPLIEGSVDMYRHPPRRMPCVPGPAPRPMLSRVFKLTSNVPALRKAYRQEEHLGNIGPRDPVALDADGAKFGEVSFDARTDGYLQDKRRIMTDNAHSSRSRVPHVRTRTGHSYARGSTDDCLDAETSKEALKQPKRTADEPTLAAWRYTTLPRTAGQREPENRK
ncbi:hypothetical protein ASPCAL05740 [Aspergillus calidoustus]|uniref:Uncharacterized protein n=1 Tax=Aspergillus calidoustus TaxID=454130 RepID=A0A0U5GUL6_ASPCI|nr:hypothetical protein ASPCAL05740 [Aspergillus calidoustus]